ncbi:MAG: zinc ribbon domain-containing protein [Chloroflexota bacterium]|nr:MAG: zinc ribbon domain-containing protein [Chloroflexota bacterium]
MPIYEYECENKHRFEKWQSMKDDPIKECPECGAAVRKILHPAGIIFKGSGWYITDSRKSPSGDAQAEKKSDQSETKSESTTPKSETKSDAKSEPSSSKSESKSESKSPSSE